MKSKNVSFYIGIEGRPTPILRHEMKPAACPLSLAISCPMPNTSFEVNRPRQSALKALSNKKQATHLTLKRQKIMLLGGKKSTPENQHGTQKRSFGRCFFSFQPFNFRGRGPPPNNLGSPSNLPKNSASQDHTRYACMPQVFAPTPRQGPPPVKRPLSAVPCVHSPVLFCILPHTTVYFCRNPVHLLIG